MGIRRGPRWQTLSRQVDVFQRSYSPRANGEGGVHVATSLHDYRPERGRRMVRSTVCVAASRLRRQRRPANLHMWTVQHLGHIPHKTRKFHRSSVQLKCPISARRSPVAGVVGRTNNKGKVFECADGVPHHVVRTGSAWDCFRYVEEGGSSRFARLTQSVRNVVISVCACDVECAQERLHESGVTLGCHAETGRHVFFDSLARRFHTEQDLTCFTFAQKLADR